MKLRKLLALAMAAVLAVSSASVAMAAELPVTNVAELKNALSSATADDVIVVKGMIELTKDDQLFINSKDLTIRGADSDAELNLYHVEEKSGGGAIVVAGSSDVTFEGLKITGANGPKYLVQCYEASATFTDCDIQGGTYASVFANGSDVTFNDTTVDSYNTNYYADVEFGMGKDVTDAPKLIINGGDIGKAYVDQDSLKKMGIEYNGGKEEVSTVVEKLKDFIDSNVDIDILLGVEGVAPNDGVMDATNPAPVVPDDNNSNRSDNDDGGDYFGNETWDEVKREIAKAEEGDTIKVSATGLPYFPSSVARALKGKDITLEIRKNGVTYEVNGLEIGDIDKIWYEFDELETELLTADADSEAPAAEDEDKTNPDTGR